MSKISVAVDVIIFGGGIAGLWSLARLRQAGYQAVLLEANALGAGQTRYAQGIIHGGTKYALTGKLTASSEAVFNMPNRWKQCLAGNGDVDLRAAIVLSAHQYLWSTQNIASRVTGFFASQVMRSRTQSVDKKNRPALFQHPQFRGQVYKLDEPVLDTMSIVRALAEPMQSAIANYQAQSLVAKDDAIEVELLDGQRVIFKYQTLCLMAGQGNAELLAQLKLTRPEMQLRPLQMVMLRGGLPGMVYAHCMGASVNPRITISSHRDMNGDIVWYLGGQLAEEGVNRSADEQIQFAKKELAALIPWLDLSKSQWATLPINRAELKQGEGKRPDSFSLDDTNPGVLTAWPTKLALAPMLADALLARLEETGVRKSASCELPTFPKPVYATLPWQEASRWN
ncbi:MAG: FAD-dependent oxidoreductase [Gammaproteobacteria bacterium]|nr:FAD-dependent oxidoreductase [Gammaproteobacteria bacterium]